MSNRSDESAQRDCLDPFLYLSLPSPAQSLCFINYNASQSSWNDSGHEESDTSSDESLNFRSSRILGNRHPRRTRQQHDNTRQQLVHGRLLVSCHRNGDALLWDCGRQTILSTLNSNRMGAGMAVKRIDDQQSLFLYQTRDPKGTVSIHALDRVGTSDMKDSIVRCYETYSATFCHAAPCRGDFDHYHLLALPARQESMAVVMDSRAPEPIFATSPITNHGMVTSLAMTTTTTTNSGTPILACGMESGSIIFHDFLSGRAVVKGECKLSNDPILALDLAPSEITKTPTITSRITSSTSKAIGSPKSVVVVAGIAGDPIEVADLPQEEQGRIALLKATSLTNDPSHLEDAWEIKTRARLATCRVDQEFSSGKPGVAVCRFRPGDARIFAVGGWDHRVRLFERSKGTPMAILRGHRGSVNALDWAPDADRSGILATAGGDDGKVLLWQCFPRDGKECKNEDGGYNHIS